MSFFYTVKFLVYVILMVFSNMIMFYIAPSLASSMDLFVSENHISGVVVSAMCSVEVESNTSNSGVINFGEHNKAIQSGIHSVQFFSVKLYESQSTSPGCSAFAIGSNLVSLKFGDRVVGQLDGHGVVTQGAGDSVRIAISSTDSEEVSSTDVITSNHSELFYSQIFASKGVFGFRANALNLELATQGTYSGALSLTVSYQ